MELIFISGLSLAISLFNYILLLKIWLKLNERKDEK